MSKFLSLLLAGTFALQGYSQKTLAEKLGYPRDSKLLIIHADDVGLSHSEDSATITALEKRAVSSASIMVPCPWFPEIAAYAKQHPELNWGVHLTLTSEWKNYKWSGVSSANEIASLLDKDGYMYASVEDFGKNAKPADVEKEIKAQIEKAISFGIKLTHIDNHMGSILAYPELATIYEKIGKQYSLPVLVPINYIRLIAPRIVNYLDTNNMAVVNNFGMAYPGVATDQWNGFYNNFIQNLKPGLNELIFHLAFDDDEFKAITIDHPDYGAAWRQRDFDYATSEEFKTLLKKDNIHVITWGDIKHVMYEP